MHAAIWAAGRRAWLAALPVDHRPTTRASIPTASSAAKTHRHWRVGRFPARFELETAIVGGSEYTHRPDAWPVCPRVAALSGPPYDGRVMRAYRYTVDVEGRIFHDGTEIVDPAVLRFFLLGMRRLPDGRFLVPCQGEENWFEAEDTPIVVQRLGLETGPHGLGAVDLILAGDYREPLDPTTLETEAGRLYCRVRRGTFRARIGRIAMQQLAPHLAETEGAPGLTVRGMTYPILET